MAKEKSYEELVAELAEKNALLKQSEKEKDEFRKAADKLSKTVQEAKVTGKVSIPVPGHYLAKWVSPNGQEMERKVEFKDGRIYTILPKMDAVVDMRGAKVPSEALLLIANGKEPKEEHLKFPAVAMLDQEKAQAVLTHLAGIGAGFLK